jgi:hypothetical protein
VARRTSSTFAASLTAMRFHGSAGLLEDVSLGGMTSGKISLTCRDLR